MSRAADRPFARALAFLRDLVAATSADRLPTVRQLSVRSGIGTGTMWRAVRHLCDEGMLRARPRSGIWVVDRTGTRSPLPNEPVVPLRPRWRQVAEQIREPLTTGEFGGFPHLPQVKELCAEFGANYRTVSKALAWLQRTGALVRVGRTYQAASWVRTAGTSASRIVLIARGSDYGELSLPTFRSRHHLFFLESLCARNGLRLQIETLFYQGTDVTGFDAIRELAVGGKGVPVTGFMVWTPGLAEAPLARLMSLLHRSNRPVAVLDELEPPPDLGAFLSSDRFRSIRVGHSQASGWQMGRYLYRKGHRSVLFVGSLSHHWFRQRRTGLVRAMSEQEPQGAVHTVDFRASGQPVELSRRRFGGAMGTVASLIGGAAAAPSGTNPRLVARLRSGVIEAASDYQRRTLLAPALLASLREHAPSAVVGGNDGLALDCLDILADEGIGVPDNIAVVGFDDGHSASLRKLTSYNFNGTAALHALVDHLISWKRHPKQKAFGGVGQIEGYVVPRRTG